MGRRKITIKQIVDPKLRHITFNKRKNGLIKKAAELSLLCNINMLLIFEDGNGNLIQFSKNKLVDIPSFFRECRYTNVLEFVAKDYPHFFKVNHYKKQKGRDDDDEDLDDLDDASDINPQTTLSQSGSQTKASGKRDRAPVASRIKEEDRNSGKMVFQSGSDESSNEGNYDMGTYNNTQPKAPLQSQQRIQIKTSKPKPMRPEEKQKIVTEDDPNLGLLNDQETTPAQKDSFQNYKDMTPRIRPEKAVDFNAPFMNFEHSFKRTNSIADTANTPFRFYPTDTPLNAPNASTNTYVNNPGFANPHPFIHNGYQTPTNNFQNNQKNNRMRGFGPLNMGNIPNEEALNAMLKGFPPLGFLGGGNPFMNKPSSKPEMDEKLIETANMIKLINGTAGANPYTGQKMYGFHPNEAGKPEDNEQMANLRNREGEGAGFDHEHEYHEMPYLRGEYRMEGNMPANIPSNLPSAYFSSKKFNFDGYFNTFEDDRFNEFGDSKKKIKP